MGPCGIHRARDMVAMGDRKVSILLRTGTVEYYSIPWNLDSLALLLRIEDQHRSQIPDTRYRARGRGARSVVSCNE
jgi:hypothetical protein